MEYKLGLIHSVPPRNTLKLAEYLNFADLPPVLPKVSWLGKVKTWPMYLNDMLGCCVVSGYGHLIQNWSAWTLNKGVTYPDDTIKKIYTTITGGPDVGMTLEDMLDYAVKPNNLWKNIYTADASVDYNDQVEMKQSIRLFGGNLLGVSLPLTAQSQVKSGGTWTVVSKSKNGKPGTWGGHCVPIVAYDSQRVFFITWGFMMSATWQFISTYAISSYAILNPLWLKNNTAPNGFNQTQLISDAGLI